VKTLLELVGLVEIGHLDLVGEQDLVRADIGFRNVVGVLGRPVLEQLCSPAHGNYEADYPLFGAVGLDVLDVQLNRDGAVGVHPVRGVLDLRTTGSRNRGEHLIHLGVKFGP
jgi:hypothetical protein